MTISSRLLVTYLALICLFSLPQMASATSASISVSGTEGAITVSAQASFTTYIVCSGSGDDEKCWPVNTGSLGVYRDTSFLASKSGKGSASWSDVLNAGLMSQGDHTLKATARDFKSIIGTSTKTITIDNTPEVSVSAGKVEGDMNVTGTVDFKENITGSEGSVAVYVDLNDDNRYWQYYGRKSFEGAALTNWTWEEITGRPLNAGTMSQGTHSLRIRATSANGTIKDEKHVFTIDHTPEVSVSAGKVEGDMNVTGTVDFKENITGNEGSVAVYVDLNDDNRYWQYYGRKSFEGADLTGWTWEEITGRPLNAGTMSQGTHSLRVRATAANGTIKDEKYVFTIDHTPEVSVSAGQVVGDMNVTGTVDFKENITGNEGSVAVYVDLNNDNRYWQYYGRKSFEGADLIGWTWEEITGRPLNAGTMSQGTHSLRVRATAANGTIKDEKYVFTIDHTPEVSVSAGKVVGDMNVTGTVDFKENITGNEGSVAVYVDLNDDNRYWQYYGRKSFEGADLTGWTWEEITGRPLNAGTMSQGTHSLRVRATAANGAIKDEKHVFTIDHTPEVSVSAGKVEGDMNATGTVDFKENITGNEGSVAVYVDLNDDNRYWQYYGRKNFEGADLTDWTWEEITGRPLNAGTMSQGTHSLRVRATAANGVIKDEKHVFTIDHTPEVSVSAGKVEGDMNVTGTVDFKENITGTEGSVAVYVDLNDDNRYWQYYGRKSFEGADLIDWIWEEITGRPLNAGTMRQGTHSLRVRATAANGAIKDEKSVFTIDNRPEVTILGSKSYPDATFDILGTTTFKENITGNEGTVALYFKEIGASYYTKHGATKSFEGKKISWKYSDFTGGRLQKSVWGRKEILVKAVATAANGASASVVKGVVIPALGCPITFSN